MFRLLTQIFFPTRKMISEQRKKKTSEWQIKDIFDTFKREKKKN